MCWGDGFGGGVGGVFLIVFKVDFGGPGTCVPPIVGAVEHGYPLVEGVSDGLDDGDSVFSAAAFQPHPGFYDGTGDEGEGIEPHLNIVTHFLHGPLTVH